MGWLTVPGSRLVPACRTMNAEVFESKFPRQRKSPNFICRLCHTASGIFKKLTPYLRPSVKLAIEHSAIETSYLVQSSKRRQEPSPVVSYQQENEWSGLLHCLHLGNAAHLLGMVLGMACLGGNSGTVIPSFPQKK